MRNERIKYGTVLGDAVLQAVFFRARSGREPVRDWLASLAVADKRKMGRDMRRLQLQWPIGMPLVRKIEPGLWEMRSTLSSGKARLLFTVDRELLIALHGFTKKSANIPATELQIARKRMAIMKAVGPS